MLRKARILEWLMQNLTKNDKLFCEHKKSWMEQFHPEQLI